MTVLKTLALVVFECNFLLACKDLKAKHEGTNDKDGPARQTDEEDEEEEEEEEAEDDIQPVNICDVSDEIEREMTESLEELRQFAGEATRLEETMSTHDLSAYVRGFTRIPCIAHKIHIVSIDNICTMPAILVGVYPT